MKVLGASHDGSLDGTEGAFTSELQQRGISCTNVSVDVDAAANSGDAELRAEYGDRLPVVLLDGEEHSYWEVDEPRLRADLDAANR